MSLAVADASPVRYLVLIGEEQVLEKLYGRLQIPETVAHELTHPSAPRLVRQWIAHLPSWVQIVEASGQGLPTMAYLDPGERAAIRLATEVSADILIMDDREGVAEAERMGLTVTGTLGVLDRAAAHGYADLIASIEKLRLTNFRAPAWLLDQLIKRASGA